MTNKIYINENKFKWTKKISYKKNGKFNFNLFIKNINWLTILMLLLLIGFLYAIESFSYFYVAIVFGKIWRGINGYPPNGYNLSTFLDRSIKFWVSPLYAYYIFWPFIWFLLIPLIIYFSSGKNGFFQYFSVSLLMYFISCFLYVIFPTTCSLGEYLQYLPSNSMFYKEIVSLANDSNNVFGSCPSFHNFWASLFVFFGLKKNTKIWWKIIMPLIGILITLSTIFLHQHTFGDILFTYILCGLIYLIDLQFNVSKKMINLWNKFIKT